MDYTKKGWYTKKKLINEHDNLKLYTASIKHKLLYYYYDHYTFLKYAF